MIAHLFRARHRAPCVVIAVTFDGVHHGHRELLRAARCRRAARGLG